jgi:antitoxin PrlF
MISWIKRTKPMKARIAERCQVVIPKPLRDRLGLRPGTVLEFAEEQGRLIAVKVDGPSPTHRVWGVVGQNFDTDAFISEIPWKTMIAAVDHSSDWQDAFRADLDPAGPGLKTDGCR